MQRGDAKNAGALCAQCGEPAGLPAQALGPSGGEGLRCAVCGGDPLLDGRYRLDALLGEGGAGVTYRATRLADGLSVCVKELAVRRLQSLEEDKLFAREADVLRQLDHPQIPAYLDSFMAGVGKHRARYLVQELVEGRNLRDELADHRYTEREVLEALDAVLDILSYLGDLRPPVVHRDVKPSNIMRRDEDGSLVLVDFGAVKDAADRSLGGSTIAGTLGYMAPEQLYGQADARSDLYGAGATALTLLSRQDAADLFTPDHATPWRDRVTMTPGTRRVLEALLAPEPQDRPGDAREARALVAQALRDLETSTPPNDAQTEQPAAPTGQAPMAPAAPPPSPAAPAFRAAETDEPLDPNDEAFALGLGRRGWGLLSGGYESGGSTLRVWLAMWAVGILVVLALVVLSTQEPEMPESQGAATAAATSAELCGGPCEPLTVPFKSKLRFGMTVDEAKAARKELTQAAAAPGDAVVSFGTEGGFPVVGAGLGNAAAPGPVIQAKMAVGGYPARCTLSFYGPGETLSALACKLSGFQDRAAYGRGLDKLRDALERRYGAPTDAGGDENAPYAGIGATEDSIGWDEGGDSLTLKGEFNDILPSLVTSSLTIEQTTAAHTQAVDQAQGRADADRRQREAARSAEEARARAKEAARLKALGGDEAL